MTTGPFDRAALHDALDTMLDRADTEGGRLEADAFWTFATMLAQGRGLTEGLHLAGIEAVRGLPKSPSKTLTDRQRRAYHIGLLAHLLIGLGRLPGQGSILPENFKHGVVAHDLKGMLGGPGAMGEGDPQILSSGKRGEIGLRREARRRLVGVVRWRMGAAGATRDAVWTDLMGGGGNAEKSKLDRWQAEFGGKSGALCREAFAAGRAGTRINSWDASNAELADVIALARSGSGKRTIDPN